MSQYLISMGLLLLLMLFQLIQALVLLSAESICDLMQPLMPLLRRMCRPPSAGLSKPHGFSSLLLHGSQDMEAALIDSLEDSVHARRQHCLMHQAHAQQGCQDLLSVVPALLGLIREGVIVPQGWL